MFFPAVLALLAATVTSSIAGLSLEVLETLAMDLVASVTPLPVPDAVCAKCASNYFDWRLTSPVESVVVSTTTTTATATTTVAAAADDAPDPEPTETIDAVESVAMSEIELTEDIANDTNNSDCHFMSFEEWKKQKVNDTKVQLDVNITDEMPARNFTASDVNNNTASPPPSTDSKVYKNRFNYASVDCAATVIQSNTHAKGAGSILVENKDSYLLNQCSSPNKFVIIELCQDILVESVVIGNFEFFSSMFKDIKVSVSDRFPSTNWKVLGEFQAQNIRDTQTFKVENPLIWARYLKLEILSHYGNEFYCPISVVRVHGKTMMEEFKENEVEVPPEQTLESLIDINPLVTEDSVNITECRVVLPHLVLNEFLRDLDYCDATVQEPETTQTTEAKTTQESIYKNIMKRLSLLESNASLSLLYIEEQSKLLSTAFTNLERRQTNNLDALIESFNSTFFTQLLSFKQSYIKMHDDYGKLFHSQEVRQRTMFHESKQQILNLSNNLNFHKKVAIFNSIIIMCLLVYVILTRDAYIGQYEEAIAPKAYPTPLFNRMKPTPKKNHNVGKKRKHRI